MNVSVHETHIGVVILLGDRALKIKKPVRTEFLDFSSRERRERACHREVELNRRLAPDAYVGVGDVRGPEGESGSTWW
jgi:aminoglycoside phosphotransferase family enzyme